MNIFKTFSKHDKSVDIYGTHETPLFLAKDIVEMLGLANGYSSINKIPKEWKEAHLHKMKGWSQARQMTFLKEPGLYKLIMRSDKKEAVNFQSWICEDVLPELRKTGEYKMNHKYSKKLTFNIQNEDDLHSKVVQFIKKRFPNSLFTTTLGEMQDTSQKRLKAWRMGYLAGSPDLVINNLNKKYTGFAI